MMAPPRQAIAVPDSVVSDVRVLVVDDLGPIRDLLSNHFQRRQMTVVTASDGLSAIQIIERQPGFDLVVTDLNMPGADGFAVLMEAKRANPECAVVIMTGYASLDSAIQAVRVGAYDYLPKPFSLSEVDQLVQRIATERVWRNIVPAAETAVGDVEELKARVQQLEDQLTALKRQQEDGIPTTR